MDQPNISLLQAKRLTNDIGMIISVRMTSVPTLPKFKAKALLLATCNIVIGYYKKNISLENATAKKVECTLPHRDMYRSSHC